MYIRLFSSCSRQHFHCNFTCYFIVFHTQIQAKMLQNICPNFVRRINFFHEPVWRHFKTVLHAVPPLTVMIKVNKPPQFRTVVSAPGNVWFGNKSWAGPWATSCDAWPQATSATWPQKKDISLLTVLFSTIQENFKLTLRPQTKPIV